MGAGGGDHLSRESLRSRNQAWTRCGKTWLPGARDPSGERLFKIKSESVKSLDFWART